ncbi:hypothetical protein B0H34DRAFT_680783 [Crassisporium funariophilum]|nr:hypothetical protein B0H34DRAFT_680783 [Crassisporium funariophilum]
MSNPNLASEQLLELLLTLKKTTPAAARGILNNQPAIAYALITLMVSMNAINIEVFQKTLAEFGANATADPASTSSAPPPAIAPAPISAVPQHMQTQYRTNTPLSNVAQAAPPLPYHQAYPNGQGGPPPQPYSHTPTPPHGNHHGGYGHQQGQGFSYQQPPSAYPNYPQYGGGQPQQAPPGASSGLTDALANIPDEQKALIMRVLSMTPEQIHALPPSERTTYIQIRATLGVPT